MENSIHHGLKGRTGQGEILAALRRGGDGVQVTVEDNGSGFPAGLLDKLGQVPAHGTESTGLGLYNVNRRLINLFGPGSRLRFSNRPEGGARIEFTIPYQADERRESTNESHDS